MFKGDVVYFCMTVIFSLAISVFSVEAVTMTQLPLSRLEGIGNSMGVKKGELGYEWSYKMDASNFSMCVLVEPELEKFKEGIVTRLRSERDTTMALVVAEPGNVTYNYQFGLKANQWKTISAAWNQFRNTDAPYDKNKKLDLEQIEIFAFFDIQAFVGGKGKNIVTIEYAEDLSAGMHHAQNDSVAGKTIKKRHLISQHDKESVKANKQENFANANKGWWDDFAKVIEDDNSTQQKDHGEWENDRPGESVKSSTSGSALSSRGEYPTGPKGSAKIHESGWTTPIRLGFNDDGWEDSPYITRDGSQILFFYHPWWNLANPKVAEKLQKIVVFESERAKRENLDGKIYVSNRPFITKEIHPVSKNKKYASADTCPYISASGDLFYDSTQHSFEMNREERVTVYKNGERLDFGTDGEESNPHYCDAKDEMWFDCPGDTNLCVMRDAGKYNFKGKVERAPYPINARNSEAVQDHMAFLTDDCQTLYFTSTRQNNTMKIYKAKRLDEKGRKWSDPKLFISHSDGVAELSMTSDGKEMVFSQIHWVGSNGVKNDIYYSRRKQDETE